MLFQFCPDHEPLIQRTDYFLDRQSFARKGHKDFTPEDKNNRCEVIQQGPEEQDSDKESDESEEEMIIEERELQIPERDKLV